RCSSRTLLSVAYLMLCVHGPRPPRDLHSFPTRRSSDLYLPTQAKSIATKVRQAAPPHSDALRRGPRPTTLLRHVSTRRREMVGRSEEHTSELQSRFDLVCRLLLEKKKTSTQRNQAQQQN